MSLYKEYKELPDGRTIRFSVNFNRGRTNWATSQPKKVGYQVTVTPVELTKGDGYVMESFAAFTGFNDCLLEVERQGSKRLAQAIAILQERMPKYLDYFTPKTAE